MWGICCLLVVLLCSQVFAAGPVVPNRITFCGLQLNLNPEAQKYVQSVVDQLHQNPKYFNRLVARTDTYLPFVEEAFQLVGVPEDLKYIVIQESSLQGDAVSSSNAVGFWQFKAETAKEVGLTVNQQVDERMHIFRSSVGAARYFYQLNRQFDNWIYAIIGYNRGPTGAIPFTNAANYGNRRMTLTGNTHWYALKAIAYKLAFQDYVGLAAKPEVWLEPQPVAGGIQVRDLVETVNIEEEQLRQYNLWIRDNVLPEGYLYTVYLPRTEANPPDTLQLEPFIAEYQEEIDQAAPEDPISTPKIGSQPWSNRRGSQFIVLDFRRDPHYREEFVVALAGQTPSEIARQNGLAPQKLESFNPGLPETLPAGEVIHLKSPNKARFHIVKKGENLRQIAGYHGVHENKIRRRNRMRRDQSELYAGQKLYLRKKKPRNERIIILELPQVQPKPEPAPSKGTTKPVPAPTPKPSQPEPKARQTPTNPPSSEKESLRLPQVTSKWVTHTVAQGETLWSISRQYGTTVGIIQQANALPNNDIKIGQQLKILKTTEK